MRAVVQRVEMAAVLITGQVISAIGRGVLVYLGIGKGDSPDDADYLLDKIINLRIFEDAEGKMNLSLADVSGEMLVVSQFTLLADCRKGRRPSFGGAEDPATAQELYELFLTKARKNIRKVESGKFQAMMKIESTNDGPVTILLDSRKVS